MKTLKEYISQVKDLHSLNEYISEQLSDVKTSWHPKKGLFTDDDPKKIVDYLMKNSKDQAQAMQRLCFYMNRGGDNLTNKTVLNKAKQLLKKEKVDEKLVVNKNYKFVGDNKFLLIYTLLWDKKKNPNYEDQVCLTIPENCKIEDDKMIMNSTDNNKTEVIFKKIDNYYFWESELNVINIYAVCLEYEEAMNFLSKIYKNVPKKINVHDYYYASPSYECEFMFYDKSIDGGKHYTKKDIDKLIDDLNK